MAGGELRRAAKGEARRAARKAAPWLELLARLGYAMRGAVYGTLGLLALLAALGQDGGRTSDARGAVQYLASLPSGTALLIAATIGLVGHGVWRLLEGLLNPRGYDNDARGFGKRFSRFVAGWVNIGLGTYAWAALNGGPPVDGEDAADDAARLVMGLPLGQLLLGAAGLAAAGLGIGLIYLAVSGNLARALRRDGIPPRPLRVLTIAGQAGSTARGAVFLLVGALLVRAAFLAKPEETVGLRGALDAIRRGPFGTAVLAAVAAGFIMYAGYCVLAALYRRLAIPGMGESDGPLS
ncbi:MAG TPA: DUF1206 domain-containing protein [Deinococcales bacterium]|nr:DUF1206 domain-containing protein [Deinococcales bacterium]